MRQRQRLPLSLDYLMFIERIPVPTRTPKLWHAMWWEAAATGRHAQSTTQVTTGNAFARLRTCQHRRHELFHLHPILCRLPLARHRSFSILTTQFDRLEPCAVKRPRRAVDAARGTVWTRRGAVTLLTHTLWRWRPFSQLLRPVRVPRMLLRQARGHSFQSLFCVIVSWYECFACRSKRFFTPVKAIASVRTVFPEQHGTKRFRSIALWRGLRGR